ncbi:MAG: POTRA domain-containing protein, partial [candidate division WOR-3 bacterium]
MQNFLLIFFLLKISNFYLKNIKIEGNKRIFSEFIKSSFGVKEGERVDFQRLSEGIKNLYKTGYFDQIEIFATTKDTFIDLIIKVSEAPRLKEIIFKENYRIKTKDLEKEISFLKGEALSKSKIFEWKKKIIDFYKNKGFAGTEVYDSILVIDDEASLIFKIKEGAKAKIKKIEIYGNEHFPDKKIEILLKNREKTWYRKANFKEEYFEEDLLKIEEFYKNKGFLSAKVDSHRINEAG